MQITETLSTPVSARCDVLVCGGGFAGIAAALSAARENKKVILLEKQYIVGGLGTAGLVTIYLPLCDGLGRQVSFGIAEELLRLSLSLGAEDKYPANWLDTTDAAQRTKEHPRFEARFNPHLFAILAEQLLLKAGVQILYGTYAVAAVRQKERIEAVIAENKSGRQAILAKAVVDATGDGDILHFAGVPTETFRQGNVLAAWYYFFGRAGYDLRMMGFCDIPEEQKTKQNKVETLVNRRFAGLDGAEISEFMQLSHQAILHDVQKQRQSDDTLWPVTIASIPQLRMTRRLCGEYTLSDQETHTYFEDSIGMVSDWRKRGPVYEVPFRTLYHASCKNLIAAGRCTSVTEPMWDIMRVIPCCAVTGQAAGLAAALTDDFTVLSPALLQQKLRQAGAVLHEKELE